MISAILYQEEYLYEITTHSRVGKNCQFLEDYIRLNSNQLQKSFFSNSGANNCEVGIQGAEEDKERDVDEKEVAESVLKLD